MHYERNANFSHAVCLLACLLAGRGTNLLEMTLGGWVVLMVGDEAQVATYQSNAR